MAKGEFPDWLYMTVHLGNTLKAVALRAQTTILDDLAPTNYLGIPLVNVVRVLTEAKRQKVKPVGEVKQEEVVYFNWPESTDTKLQKGQVMRPGGSHPEHEDV